MTTEELTTELDENRALGLLLSFAMVFLVIEVSIIFIIISIKFVSVFINSIILFFFGIAFTRWYARKKEMDDSKRKAFYLFNQ